MRRAAFVVSTILILALATSAAAQMATIVKPDDVKFTDIKDSPGWKIAPLFGDMTKKGFFIDRMSSCRPIRTR